MRTHYVIFRVVGNREPGVLNIRNDTDNFYRNIRSDLDVPAHRVSSGKQTAGKGMAQEAQVEAGAPILLAKRPAFQYRYPENREVSGGNVTPID
jgi:hypothetical protein